MSSSDQALDVLAENQYNNEEGVNLNRSGQADLKTLIASVALMAVLSISGVFLYKFIHFQSMSKVQRLNYLWKRDMNILKGSKHLHPGIKQVREFEAFAGSDGAKKWLPQLQVPWKKLEKGKYKLEILLLDFNENNQDHAVIQLNLVEIESENMIWELGRTYQLESYFYAIF